MASENPINLQLKSFARFDEAMAMCDLLNNETGAEYTVISDNHLGFTVKRNQENKVNEQQKSVVSDNGNPLEKMAYRQCIQRLYSEHFSELAIGILSGR